MKILILNSEYPPVGGGASTASANLAQCFHELEHEVYVLTLGYADLDSLTNEKGIKVLRVKTKRKSPSSTGFIEQIRFAFEARNEIEKLLLSWRPDVILAFFTAPCGIVAREIKKKFAIPYVVSLRGGDVPGYRTEDFWYYHFFGLPVIKMVWESADAIATNGGYLKLLAQKVVKGLNISIIPNGIKTEIIEKKNRDSQRNVRLLAGGRFVKQKGFDVLLKALSRVRSSNWDLVLFGDGKQERQIRSLIKKFKLERKISLPGWIERGAVSQLYDKSDIFILPSRQEGMSNALLEAMASGIAVVASDILGNQELVSGGRTGVLVKSEDPDSLSLALDTLIADKVLREQLGRAAKSWVVSNFEWDGFAKKYINLFEQVLGKK